MAIVTPLMLKQMYNDNELQKLTTQAHALFDLHFHEKVANNRSFHHPTPKDARSLSFKYEGLNPHKNKIAISPEKRRPLSAPNKNSPHYREPDNESEVDVDHFDYHYNLPSDLVNEESKDDDDNVLAKLRLSSSPLRGGAGSSLRRTTPVKPKLSYSVEHHKKSARLMKSLDSALGLPSIAAGDQSPQPLEAFSPLRGGGGPHISRQHMQERRLKLEAESAALYQQVFEEAKLIQQKFTTCIHEANLFSQALGRTLKYRLVKRGAEEDAAWDNILRDQNHARGQAHIPSGTGKRIEKMLVEVTEEGRDIRYLGVNHFQREHSRLQLAVNKQLSVLPLMPISDPDEEDRKMHEARLAAEEHAARVKDRHAKRRHSNASLPTPDHAAALSSLPPATAAAKIAAAIAAAAAKAQCGAGPSAPGVEDKERALLLKSGLRPPRKEVEAKLREILNKETSKFLQLRAQFEQVARLGWNQTEAQVIASLGR